MIQVIKKLFKLRPDMGLNFYVADFFFRKILRQNARVKWAIHHTSTIHSPEKLVKGRHTWPGDSPGVYINAFNGIMVGDYTNIGPNVAIVSANHDFINNDVHLGAAPIEIGRFCWIGAGAVILPGVKLGDFTMVGAGAIVTKSAEEGYCVLAGNPAKVIRTLDREACAAFAASRS